MSSSPSSSSSRIRENMSQIPMCTFFFMILCLSTFLFQILANPSVHSYTLNPNLIIYQHQYYRMVTSAFFHGGIMHIAMNVMSLWQLGTSLEKTFGSLWTMLTILWSIVLTPSIYILIALVTHLFLSTGIVPMPMEDLMKRHSLGFSGILFHLLTVECAKHHDHSHSVFGMIVVSSKYYPWVMLLVMQVIMPNVSFVGHLSGILVGILQCHGCGYSHLNRIMRMAPSAAWLRQCDDNARLQCITRRVGYIRTPSPSSNSSGHDVFSIFANDRAGDRRNNIRSGVGIFMTFVTHVSEAVRHIVFGGGHSHSIAEDESEALALNDDERNGLPDVPVPDSSSVSSSNEFTSMTEMV